MPVSLPEGEVGVSVSFRTISLPFEAIRAEYLSRTQWLRKGRPSCPFCTWYKLAPWPKTDDIYNYIYIYIYIYRRTRCTTRTCGARSGSPQIYIDALAVLLVHVGLAQARPKYSVLQKVAQLTKRRVAMLHFDEAESLESKFQRLVDFTDELVGKQEELEKL